MTRANFIRLAITSAYWGFTAAALIHASSTGMGWIGVDRAISFGLCIWAYAVVQRDIGEEP